MELELKIRGDASQLAAVLAALGAGSASLRHVAPDAESTDHGNVTVQHDAPQPPMPPVAAGLGGERAVAPAPVEPQADSNDGQASDATGNDSTGLPWDDRIHSTPASKNKDGTWRKRRGLDEATFQTIAAELRAGSTVPAMPPAPTGEGVAPVQPPAPPAPPSAVPMPPPVPAPPSDVPAPPAPPAPPVDAAAPPPPPVAPAPSADVPQDFATLMVAIGPKMGEGPNQLSPEYLATACAAVGISTITDLAPAPEKIAEFVGQLQADGRW